MTRQRVVCIQAVKGHNFKRITNQPAPIIWVFKAQLVEHCSANADSSQVMQRTRSISVVKYLNMANF